MTTIIVDGITTFLSFPQVTFSPKSIDILAITNAKDAEVTTDGDHGYSTGLTVQLMVPPPYGMEVNNVYCKITVTSPTTFLTGLNTLQLDSFSIPLEVQPLPAQSVPVTGTVLNDYEPT